MHLSVIVPPGCEDLLIGEGTPVKSVMCFANIAWENKEYRHWYAEYRGWKVMDNEIYEGKPPLDPSKLAVMMWAIQPDVLIVPDVRGDVEQTIMYAGEYLPRLHASLNKDPYNNTVNLCGVVQGKTSLEIERCMWFWVDKIMVGEVQMVAVPMRVDGREMSRRQVYEEIVRPLLPSRAKVHLLGVEKWPYMDEQELARYPEVVSCDTAEPTSAALRGVLISNEGAGDAVRRPDRFMEDDSIKVILRGSKERLWRNFSRVQDKFMGPRATRMASSPTDAPTTE